MGRKTRNRKKEPQGAPATRSRVVLCRGGDCGSKQKHGETDHRDQLRRFREALGRDLVVSGCLDACEHSNVVVAVPGTAAERKGAQPVWIGEVLDDETAEDVLSWATTGVSTDPAEWPTLVQIKQFAPTRRNLQELKVELRPD